LLPWAPKLCAPTTCTRCMSLSCTSGVIIQTWSPNQQSWALMQHKEALFYKTLQENSVLTILLCCHVNGRDNRSSRGKWRRWGLSSLV
jgi:hypothetical protein